eukprot:IDg21508t1
MVAYLKSRVAAGRHLLDIDDIYAQGTYQIFCRFRFRNNRTTLKKYDVASLSRLMEVLNKTNSTKSVNFMDKPLYNFENLRKQNKDVPQISKAYEIDIVLVGEVPRVYTKDKLEEEAPRMDKRELLKRGVVCNIDTFLLYPNSTMSHRLMSKKRHDQ